MLYWYSQVSPVSSFPSVRTDPRSKCFNLSFNLPVDRVSFGGLCSLSLYPFVGERDTHFPWINLPNDISWASISETCCRCNIGLLDRPTDRPTDRRFLFVGSAFSIYVLLINELAGWLASSLFHFSGFSEYSCLSAFELLRSLERKKSITSNRQLALDALSWPGLSGQTFEFNASFSVLLSATAMRFE